MIKKNKNILFSGDKNVLKYLSVVMESVEQNTTGEVTYHVMYPAGDVEATSILDTLADKFKIKSYGIPEHVGLELSYTAGKRWPQSAFYPLFAIDYLPDNLESIVVLDCDTLVVNNIDDLFEMSFDGKMLLATSSWIKGLAESYSPKGTNYDFNSGIYRINLSKWRENHINLDTWKNAQRRLYAKKATMFDQDLLNEVFSVNHTKFINKSFNVNPSLYQIAKNSKEFDGIKIIHYTNNHYFEGKPWSLQILASDIDDSTDNYFYKIDRNIYEIVSQWWSYAPSSPFFSEFVHDAKVLGKFYKKYGKSHYKNEAKYRESYNKLKADYNNVTAMLNVYRSKKKDEILNYSVDSVYHALFNKHSFAKKIEKNNVDFVKLIEDNNYVVVPFYETLSLNKKYSLDLFVMSDINMSVNVYIRQHHNNKQFIGKFDLTNEIQHFSTSFTSDNTMYKDIALIPSNNSVGTHLSINKIIIKVLD